MHHIGVVGASWRSGRPHTLEALTIPREGRPERLPGIAAAAHSDGVVYLATCNRVEVAFTLDGTMPLSVRRRRVYAALVGRDLRPGEAEQGLKAWQGEGAVEHLFLVVAGLDSARIGESEVASQVRQAVEDSRAAGLLTPPLERLFAEATKVARRVRPLSQAHVGEVSIADIAVRHVLERLERTPGTAALIGVSPMTVRCARELRRRGVAVVIVNRTLARAESLATEVGGRGVSLDAFRADPIAVEVIVAATASPDPLLGRADLERLAARTPSGEPPLVIDLSVPPNIAPEDAGAADVPRLGMHEISEEAAVDRNRVLLEFGDARAVVDEALTTYRRQTSERLVGPLIAALRLRYRHTADEAIDRLLERHLTGLGPAEQQAVRRWAETLAARFAHLPSVGLRDLAFEAGPRAVAAFFDRGEPELARRLRDEVTRPGIAEFDRDLEDA